jgi:hypothetical protein
MKRQWTAQRMGMKDHSRGREYVLMKWIDGSGNKIIRKRRDYFLEKPGGDIYDLEAQTLAEAKKEVEEYL